LQVLWEYFTMALPDSDPDMSRDAILLLGMCGLSEVSIIRANKEVGAQMRFVLSSNIRFFQVIVEHGLGERATTDFRLARNSCEALLRLVPAKLKQDDPNPPLK
jgi:hypothetical protein